MPIECVSGTVVAVTAPYERENVRLNLSKCTFCAQISSSIPLYFLVFFFFLSIFAYNSNLWMRLVGYSVYCVCEMGDNDMRMHNIQVADDKPTNNKNVFVMAFECRTLWKGI